MSESKLQDLSIAVLAGGTSAEREVSLMSGAVIVEYLRPLCRELTVIDPQDSGWTSRLAGVDFVFNILHGGIGENGAVQGLLMSLGIPQSGSGVLGAALGMDKLRTKAIWRDLGLPVAPEALLTAESDFDQVIADLGEVFVKPAFEGSSLGMSIAKTGSELREAFARAESFSGPDFAEQRIIGEEYTVAILGDRVLPAIRLSATADFYDYHAKYLAEDTQYFCPCGLDSEAEQGICELALRAFAAVGCSVWGRVDLMMDSKGKVALLEVNTVPGMTTHSLVPMAARAAGLSMSDLLVEIITLSLERGCQS
ncbi:MAG: hypothetical protein RLZZ602_2146 [Pseudomonadota bacterium]